MLCVFFGYNGVGLDCNGWLFRDQFLTPLVWLVFCPVELFYCVLFYRSS